MSTAQIKEQLDSLEKEILKRIKDGPPPDSIHLPVREMGIMVRTWDMIVRGSLAGY